MDKLVISSSPHIKSKTTTTMIMLDVIIALIPALIASVFIFGIRALLVTAVCVAASVLSELLFEKLCKRPVTVGDLSAVVTGMLLAYNLPVSIPLWQAVIGSVVAIVVVKQLFGGIGMNFANPAITARIVMLVSFSGTMSNWTAPTANILSLNTDLTASATPLSWLTEPSSVASFTLSDVFLGRIGGCIGETCTLALIAGGIYLVAKKVITIHIPAVFVATVFVMSLLCTPDGIGSFDYALLQILSGGLFLGAIFMATDYTTSPATGWGKVVFAAGCGIITFAIRRWGTLPEGISYAILFMNILAPYINKLTATRPFGGVKPDEK